MWFMVLGLDWQVCCRVLEMVGKMLIGWVFPHACAAKEQAGSHKLPTSAGGAPDVSQEDHILCDARV